VPSIWKEAGVGSFFEVSGKAPDRDPDLLDIRFFEIIHLAANYEKLSRARERALIQASLRGTYEESWIRLSGYMAQTL
jgi:hypothetical protein